MKKSRWIYFWQAMLYLGIFLLVQVVVTVPIAISAGVRLGMDLTQDGAAFTDMNRIVTELVQSIMGPTILISGLISAVVCAVVMCVQTPGRSLKAALSLNGFSPWLILPLLFTGVFMNLWVEGVFQYLPESWVQSYSQSSTYLDGGNGILIVLGAVIGAPLSEEIAFRAGMLTRMRRGFSWTVAILMQGVIFGLCHGQALWFAYAALLGIVMGWVFKTLKSTLATILIHVGFNSVSFLLSIERIAGWFDKIPVDVLTGLSFCLTALCLVAIGLQGGTDNVKEPFAWADPSPSEPQAAPVRAASPYGQTAVPYGYGNPQAPYAGMQQPYVPQQPAMPQQPVWNGQPYAPRQPGAYVPGPVPQQQVPPVYPQQPEAPAYPQEPPAPGAGPEGPQDGQG